MSPHLVIAGVAVFLLSGCATRTAASQPPQDRSRVVVAAESSSVPAADRTEPASIGAASDSVPSSIAPERSLPSPAVISDATTQQVPPRAGEATRGASSVHAAAIAVDPGTGASSRSSDDAETVPSAGPLQAFDSQLIAITRNSNAADEAFASLPADERELLTTVVDSLARFRVALGNPGGLLAHKAAPLINLADELHARAPLSLPVVALCSEVTQFGVYDPIDPPSFIAGRETPTIVYCEVDHFRSEPTEDRHWRTRLTYEAVLYSGSDPAVSIITRKPAGVVDLCRNRRRDFFLADRLTIPASLPVGRYVLKVTVMDELANRVAEATIPITLSAQ